MTTFDLANRTKQIQASRTLTVDAKAKELKAAGEDIISFSAGEPDFDTPEHIKMAAMGALEAGMTKYTPSSGILELRQAICEKLSAENNVSYQPHQITVSCGAKHACLNAILATINPGDEVIIPSPYWTSYPEMVRIAGGEPYIVPTTAENDYKITPEQLAESISPATKMLILNTPANPTGTVYTEKELVQLVEVAIEEDLIILADEIYEKLVYDDAQHVSIASFSPGVYNRTITVNGFSKTYAMTGWRLGYTAAPKPIAEAIDRIQSHSTSNVTSFAQRGALAALKGPQQCVQDMRAEYDKRRQRCIEILRTIPKLSCNTPKGAFYILVDISKTGLSSEDFAEQLLTKEKVAVVPGSAFGDDSVIRISYATSMENIERGLGRLANFCASIV